MCLSPGAGARAQQCAGLPGVGALLIGQAALEAALETLEALALSIRMAPSPRPSSTLSCWPIRSAQITDVFAVQLKDRCLSLRRGSQPEGGDRRPAARPAEPHRVMLLNAYSELTEFGSPLLGGLRLGLRSFAG